MSARPAGRRCGAWAAYAARMSVSSVRSSSPTQGVVGSVTAGYQLAWAKRQALLAVVVPPMAAAALLRLALGRLGGGHADLIVNGVPQPAANPAWVGWVALIATVLCWSVAIAAGTAVIAGALLGSPVGAATAWRLGLRACVPVIAAVVLSAVLAGAALLLLAAFVGGSGGGLLVWGALLLVPVGAVLSRVALVVPAAVLGGRAGARPLEAAFTLTRGRVLRTAGPVLLGAAFVPLLMAWLGNDVLARWLADVTPHNRLGWLLAAAGQQLLSAVVIVVVTAAQAATLATAYLRRLIDLGDPAVTDAAVADLTDVDQWSGRPATTAGRRPAFPRAARAAVGAALLLPAICAAAVGAVDPYHAPSVREHDLRLAGLVLAVAWPAGRHPVIVTDFDAYDCPDDECHDPVPRGMRADFAMQSGAVTIGGDGSVVAGIIVRPAGQDQVKLERCPASGACRAIGPVPLPSGDDQPQPNLALGVAPDGTPVLATVGDLSKAADAAPSAQLALIRCLYTNCTQSERTVLGTVPVSSNTSVAGTDALSAAVGGPGLPTASPALRLDTDPTGRPIITFRAAAHVWRATCQPDTCAQPRLVDDQAIPGDRFTPTGGVDDAVLTLTDNGLVRCQLTACSPPTLYPPGLPGESDLVATAGGVFVVLGAPGPPPSGLHITIGPKPEPRQYTLWHCPDADCLHPHSITLPVTQSPARQTWLATQPDGQVLLLQNNGATINALTVNTAAC